MYQNFVNLTDAIKTKANKLIATFNFPIQLPEFYKPEAGVVETLQVVIESASSEQKAIAAEKVSRGMNRDMFKINGGAKEGSGDSNANKN